MSKSFPILGANLLAVGATAETQPSSTGSAEALALQKAARIALEKNP